MKADALRKFTWRVDDVEVDSSDERKLARAVAAERRRKIDETSTHNKGS